MSKKFNFDSDEENNNEELNENKKRVIKQDEYESNKKQKNEKINVFVLYNGRTIEIKDVGTLNIYMIKSQLLLNDNFELNANLFELYFKGEKLKEENFITDYGILHEDKSELIENEKVPCGKKIF